MVIRYCQSLLSFDLFKRPSIFLGLQKVYLLDLWGENIDILNWPWLLKTWCTWLKFPFILKGVWGYFFGYFIPSFGGFLLSRPDAWSEVSPESKEEISGDDLAIAMGEENNKYNNGEVEGVRDTETDGNEGMFMDLWLGLRHTWIKFWHVETANRVSKIYFRILSDQNFWVQ